MTNTRTTTKTNRYCRAALTALAIIVTTDAKDLAGNRLDQNPSKAGNQPKVWRFTVRR